MLDQAAYQQEGRRGNTYFHTNIAKNRIKNKLIAKETKTKSNFVALTLALILANCSQSVERPQKETKRI